MNDTATDAGAQHCIALRCITMHYLALRIGAEPRYRYTDPGLLAKHSGASLKQT